MVYVMQMARTNIDIDDEACTEVMRRYRLATKREAVNLALRMVAAEPLGPDEARKLRGSGWDGDLDEMRFRQSEPPDALSRPTFSPASPRTATRWVIYR